MVQKCDVSKLLAAKKSNKNGAKEANRHRRRVATNVSDGVKGVTRIGRYRDRGKVVVCVFINDLKTSLQLCLLALSSYPSRLVIPLCRVCSVRHGFVCVCAVRCFRGEWASAIIKQIGHSTRCTIQSMKRPFTPTSNDINHFFYFPLKIFSDKLTYLQFKNSFYHIKVFSKNISIYRQKAIVLKQLVQLCFY